MCNQNKLIWILQNCLLLLSCPVVLIIVIHFCMVLLTLTPQGFKRVQNQLARLVTKSPPFTRGLSLLRSLHWLPVRFRILFEIYLLTHKTLHEKTACLSSFHDGCIDSFAFTEIKQ